MKKPDTIHDVYVQSEEEYSLRDYEEIIRLECERMERLIHTHSYLSEGDKFLAEITQKPNYIGMGDSVADQLNNSLYQRFSANTAFYGVPQRPYAPPSTIARPAPYELAKKQVIGDDAAVADFLVSAGKVICVSNIFWANYHYLLQSKADMSDTAHYGWEERIEEIPVSLATTCYRHTPFTFQSWLLYRAPCEKGPLLIVLDESQLDWVKENALHLVPEDSQYLILSADRPQYAPCDQLEGVSVGGLSLFSMGHTDLQEGVNSELWELPEKAPKISVVICSYNQGEFLEKCIRSILDQRYPNLELIVVDGNSTDNSISLLEQYRAAFAHLIIEDDNGQSDALNKGFSLSTGDIMTWVCSDDGLEPGSLLTVAKTFVQNDELDVVVGGCRRIGMRGENLSVHHTHLPYEEQVRLSFGDMISFGHTWLRGFYFIQPELFWSRRVWEKSGAYIKNHMFFAMDYELFLRFALAGAQAFHIKKCLAFALVHDAQKSAHQGRNLPTIMRMMDEFQVMVRSLQNDPT